MYVCCAQYIYCIILTVVIQSYHIIHIIRTAALPMHALGSSPGHSQILMLHVEKRRATLKAGSGLGTRLPMHAYSYSYCCYYILYYTRQCMLIFFVYSSQFVHMHPHVHGMSSYLVFLSCLSDNYSAQFSYADV